MRVQFSTARFEFAHGRKPKGEGMWAFDFGADVVFAPFAENFSQAKRWAAGEAKRRNFSGVVHVAP